MFTFSVYFTSQSWRQIGGDKLRPKSWTGHDLINYTCTKNHTAKCYKFLGIQLSSNLHNISSLKWNSARSRGDSPSTITTKGLTTFKLHFIPWNFLSDLFDEKKRKKKNRRRGKKLRGTRPFTHQILPAWILQFIHLYKSIKDSISFHEMN